MPTVSSLMLTRLTGIFYFENLSLLRTLLPVCFRSAFPCLSVSSKELQALSLAPITRGIDKSLVTPSATYLTEPT